MTEQRTELEKVMDDFHRLQGNLASAEKQMIEHVRRVYEFAADNENSEAWLSALLYFDPQNNVKRKTLFECVGEIRSFRTSLSQSIKASKAK